MLHSAVGSICRRHPRTTALGLCKRRLRIPSQRSFSALQRSFATAGAPDTSNSSEYDVVISGGGIVGCILACQLALHATADVGRIALVDLFPPQSLDSLRDKPQPDIRVYALSPASVDVLRDIGVWDRLLDVRPNIGRSVEMQVWDCASDSHVVFHGSADDPLNYVVEHDLLLAALNDRVAELAAQGSSSPASARDGTDVAACIDVFSPGSLSKQFFVVPDNAHEWIQCAIDCGDKSVVPVRCRLLIGADGAQSQVRAACGLGSWGWEYKHAAVVATVRTVTWNDLESPADATDVDTTLPRHSTAWQRFLPTGPLALLPLHADYSSIVWSTSTAEAERLKRLGDDDFLEELNRALHDPSYLNDDGRAPGGTDNSSGGGGLGMALTAVDGVLRSISTALNSAAAAANREASSSSSSSYSSSSSFRPPPEVGAVCSPRFSFPLKFNQASQYYRPRVALLGDAAHTIHPLAGQGLNLGIADAKALGDILGDAASAGQDLGSSITLAKYEEARKVPNLLMGGGVDAIKRAYELPRELAALRGLGVNFVNAFAPLKNQLVKAAKGQQLWSAEPPAAKPQKRRRRRNADEWLEATDPATGQPYFYHQVTRETRWQRP